MAQAKDIVEDLKGVVNSMSDLLESMGLDRHAFLNTSVEDFLQVSEGRPKEPVLRKLGRIVSITEGQDTEANGHARSILEAFTARRVSGMMEQCPICANEMLATYECLTCGFSMIEDFRCPMLSEDGRRTCRKTDKSCDLFGLEFETCGVFNNSV